MQKNVYSIVLSSDVVAAIDRLAYSNGTSRSNMINQILAEYVSYTTPEKRLGDIFKRAVELIEDTEQLQIMLRPSDTMLSLKSALRYKYNPTVRYSVELYKDSEALGELRVSLRTQSSGLIYYIDSFFRLWQRTEERQIENSPSSERAEGRYSRLLKCPECKDGDLLGEAIVSYVGLMDRCMKLFFACVGQETSVEDKIDKLYAEYKKSNILL